jgi:hypothetical protein
MVNKKVFLPIYIFRLMIDFLLLEAEIKEVTEVSEELKEDQEVNCPTHLREPSSLIRQILLSSKT